MGRAPARRHRPEAEGAEADAEALQSHLAAGFAKWWLPDDYVFIDEIPRTSTGKFLKSALRERYEGLLVAGEEGGGS